MSQQSEGSNKIIFTLYDIEGRDNFYEKSKQEIAAYLQQTYLDQNLDEGKAVPEVEIQLIGDLTDKGKGNIALVEQIAKDLNELKLCEGKVTTKVKVFTGNREGTKLRLKDELRLCNVDKVVALEAKLSPEQLALGQKERLDLNRKTPGNKKKLSARPQQPTEAITLDGLAWSDGCNSSFLQFLWEIQQGKKAPDGCIGKTQRDDAIEYYHTLSEDTKLNLYMRYLFAKTMGAPNFLTDVAEELKIDITGKDATDPAWKKLRQTVMAHFATATEKNAYHSIQKNLLVADYDKSTKTLTSHSGPGGNFSHTKKLEEILAAYFKKENGKHVFELDSTQLLKLRTEYEKRVNERKSYEKTVFLYNTAHSVLMCNLQFLYGEMEKEEEIYKEWKKQPENIKKSAADFTYQRDEKIAKKYALLKQLHKQFVLLGLPPHVHGNRSTINHNQVGKDGSFGHEPYSFNTNFGHKPAGFPRFSAHVDDKGITHYCTNGDSTNYEDAYRFLVTEYNVQGITGRKFVYQPQDQKQQILRLPAQHKSGELYGKNKAGYHILLAENEPFRYSGSCLRDFLQTGLFVDNNHKTINFNDEHVKQLLSCNVIVSEDNKSARVVRQDSTPPFASIALNIDLTGPARQSATAFLQEVSNRYKAFYAEKLPRKKLVGEGEETAEAQQKREEKNESITKQFANMQAASLDKVRDENYTLNQMRLALGNCESVEEFERLYQQLYYIEAARKNMRPLQELITSKSELMEKENKPEEDHFDNDFSSQFTPLSAENSSISDNLSDNSPLSTNKEMPSPAERLKAMLLDWPQYGGITLQNRKQKAAVIIKTEIAACQTAAEVVALYNILRDSKYDFLRLKRNSLPSLHAETRTWSVDILTALKKRYVSLQLDAQKQQDIPLQESTSKQNLSSASQENTSNNSEHSIEHQEKLGTGESISLHEFPAADKTSRKNVMYNAEDLLTEKRYWNVFKNKANGFQDLLTRLQATTDSTPATRERVRTTLLMKK